MAKRKTKAEREAEARLDEQKERLKDQIETAKEQIDAAIAVVRKTRGRVLIVTEDEEDRPDPEAEAEANRAVSDAHEILHNIRRALGHLDQDAIHMANDISIVSDHMAEFGAASPATIYGFGRVNQGLIALGAAAALVSDAIETLFTCLKVDAVEEVTSDDEEEHHEVGVKNCGTCPRREGCPVLLSRQKSRATLN